MPDDKIYATSEQAANNTNTGNTNTGNTNTGNTNTGSSNSGSSNVPPSVNGGTVVSRAYSQLGKPYSWGACGPNSFDCSGFVSYCLTGSYSRLGTTYTFLGWNEVSDPQPGDVCVNAGHTGIYIGGGQMIHAASPSEGIIVGPVQSGMIYVRY